MHLANADAPTTADSVQFSSPHLIATALYVDILQCQVCQLFRNIHGQVAQGVTYNPDILTASCAPTPYNIFYLRLIEHKMANSVWVNIQKHASGFKVLSTVTSAGMYLTFTSTQSKLSKSMLMTKEG